MTSAFALYWSYTSTGSMIVKCLAFACVHTNVALQNYHLLQGTVFLSMLWAILFHAPRFFCLSSVPSPGSVCALDCASLSVEWSSRTWGHRLFYGCFSWYSSLFSWSGLSNHCLAVLLETPLGHTQLQSSVAPSAQGRQCLSLFSFTFICHHSTHFLSCTDLWCTLVCPHSVTDNRIYIY